MYGLQKASDLDNLLKDRVSGGIFFTTLQKFEEETGIKVKISNGVMEIRHRWDVVGEFVLTV